MHDDTFGFAALVFDWAGTTVDHGCMAPVAPFLEVFGRRGIALDDATVRGPMGIHKRLHIERLCAVPAVSAAWQARFGRAPQREDVAALFAEMLPLQLACLGAHATPIAGCLETMRFLRARGIRVGTTTGYTRAMMDVLAPAAAAQGFAPDVVVASDEVLEARPAPDMCLRNLALLGVSDARATVKVDDTTTGIEEGLRAGMWTIGVVMTGNELGLTAPELAALPAVERARRRQAGYARLYAAGAHLVVDGIADLPCALETLGARRRLSRAA